jgi:glycosyltransferase involved in cell wall biosynthesis
MPARRTIRRTSYGGLAAAGVVAAATLSWPVVVLALIAAVFLLVWEVRGLRIRLGAQVERSARIVERAAEQRRLQVCLATEVYDQARLLGRDFPVEAGPLILRSLIARGDVLDAYRLVGRGDLAEIPAPNLRRLRDGLQRRGYFDWALTVAEAIADRNESDERVLGTLRGEIAVTSGAFVPVVPVSPGFSAQWEGPDAGSNTVLHLVGKSLPHSQAGYTLRTHYIAIAQRDAGLDPHVATQTGFAADAGPAEVVDGITYHRLAGPALQSVPQDVWLAQHVARVADLVASLRPAVLHAASDYLNALTATAVGTAYGIPVVYESRGFWEETYLSRQQQRYGWDLATHAEEYGLPDFYLRRRAVEDRVRRAADRVVTLAGVMADRIVAGGVPREHVEVVPNAVDVDAFPIPRRDHELAARHGIAADATVIGYISSLAEYEGIDTLIAAYEKVAAVADGPVALLVVGDGAARADLEARAAGLAGVHFTGQVPHETILSWYGLIDIFVVPRRPVEVCHLVTPLKPFEAFATGRTVVLSDVRALASIAADSGAAELFTAGDPDSLAEVLLRLLRDPARRRELAEAGAAWVRAERTWAANARTYLRLYADLRVTGVPRQITASGTGSAAVPAAGRTSP